MEGAAQGTRPDRDTRSLQPRPAAGTGADPLRTHGPQSVHVPARLGGADGARPRHDAVHRHRRAGVRRLPPAQLRHVCDTRAQPGLRPQRFRRDAPRTVGVGPEAPGRELRDRRTRQSPAGRRRPPRGPGVRARLSRASARVLEDATAGSLVQAHGCEGADRRGTQCRRAQIPAEIAKRARERVLENLFPKITTLVGGRHRIVDQPPILFHVAEPDFVDACRRGVGGLPQHAFRRSPRAARPLPAGGLRAQGRGHRQRRHALLYRAHVLRGRASVDPPVQGSRPLRPRALCRRRARTRTRASASSPGSG